jgi:hypothetical protein
MDSNRLIGQALLQALRHRAAILAMLCFIALVMMSGLPRGASALMVGSTPGVWTDGNHPVGATQVGDASVNPATAGSGWSGGDPGWANVAHTSANLNAVYIGDGWMLSAYHTGVNPVTFIESNQTFNPIPNQGTTPGEGYPVSNADLRLYRINGDPALLSPTIKPITIASQSLAVNDQVMFIANGVTRDATEYHWNVTPVAGDNNDIWTQVGSCSGSNCYHGYGVANYGKRWGVNNVVDDRAVFGSSESDADITIAINGTTIANLTQYSKQAAPCSGTNCFQAQVVSGDSGSGVFHKRGSVWELAGITTNIFAFDNQNTTAAIYRDVPQQTNFIPPLYSTGDASAFADLSSYYTQILAIKSAHPDYSAVGDLDLDGTAGTAADIAAFVAGWRYNNGSGTGTITSWKNGDLTHDGKTDVNDFLRFRSGLSAGAGAELTALMSNYFSGGVPEPSTAMLLLGSAVVVALRFRRRFPRLAV